MGHMQLCCSCFFARPTYNFKYVESWPSLVAAKNTEGGKCTIDLQTNPPDPPPFEICPNLSFFIASFFKLEL